MAKRQTFKFSRILFAQVAEFPYFYYNRPILSEAEYYALKDMVCKGKEWEKFLTERFEKKELLISFIYLSILALLFWALLSKNILNFSPVLHTCLIWIFGGLIIKTLITFLILTVTYFISSLEKFVFIKQIQKGISQSMSYSDFSIFVWGRDLSDLKES